MSLEKAPKHVQLAVDLIDLLETNDVDNKTAVKALQIVLADFQRKLEEGESWSKVECHKSATLERRFFYFFFVANGLSDDLNSKEIGVPMIFSTWRNLFSKNFL